LPTCKDFLRELGEFLDQSLDPATRLELERHVNECPNCWVVLDTTKKTIQVYKGQEPKAIPAEIHNRLMEALRKKMAAKRCGSQPSTEP
jgi:anti-sigma factor RsiW